MHCQETPLPFLSRHPGILFSISCAFSLCDHIASPCNYEKNRTRMIGLPLLLLLLLFWLLSPTSAKRIPVTCVSANTFQSQQDYHTPGDFMIGGNLFLTNMIDFDHSDFQKQPSTISSTLVPLSKSLKHFLTLKFAVREVNRSLILLPNITLGFRIYDNDDTERNIYLVSLSLLSTRGQTVPGYKCDRQGPLLSLGVGFEFSQGDRRVYPSFFRINPEETHQYVSLVQLLLYFQWNWVGLVASKDDSGEHFVSSLVPMLKEKEICLVFPEIFSSDIKELEMQLVFKILLEVEVTILFGDSHIIMLVAITLFRYTKSISLRKVWILPSYCELSVLGSKEMLQFRKYFHGTLHFRDQTRDVSEFSRFLLSLDPLNPEGDDLFLL
ncbi:hypothetical protein E2320_022111, partial [Naja naja]